MATGTTNDFNYSRDQIINEALRKLGVLALEDNAETATLWAVTMELAASPTSLTITAPDGVTTGKISVQTDQGIVYSEQNFTVGAPSNGCGCS